MRTHQAFEMFMTVHIRDFNRESWEAILVYRGFTDILYGSSSVSHHR